VHIISVHALLLSSEIECCFKDVRFPNVTLTQVTLSPMLLPPLKALFLFEAYYIIRWFNNPGTNTMKKKTESTTILGKGTDFEGKLVFHGIIRVDGHFKGEIISDGTLIVGQEGMIQANMHVSYVVVSGEVHGNITAEQRVDLRAPGKVFGNIQAPVVVIDEGVIFEGTTRMYQAKGSNHQQSDVVDADDYSGGPPQHLVAIYGIVSDEVSGQPVKNAKVKCKGSEKKYTETNASGYYEAINLKQGKWKIKIKAKGYSKTVTNVEIPGESTVEHNIVLKPKRR